MILRRFNNDGMSKFKEFLLEVDGKAKIDKSQDLLISSEFTDSIGKDIKLQEVQFSNRHEVGKYCYKLFSENNIDDADNQIWTWMSYYFFEQLCKKSRGGAYTPGELAKWLPSSDYRKHYRHLLKGPYNICKLHADDLDAAMIVLYTSPDSPGDIYEQLCSRQEMVTNPVFITTATKLYYDKSIGKQKRGSAGSGNSPGNVRRLVDISYQLDLTWDLYSINNETLYDILPSEFDRFKD